MHGLAVDRDDGGTRPCRRPLARPEGDSLPLPHLDSEANLHAGAIDIDLEARLQSRAMHESGIPVHCISRSNLADAAYWTAVQLVAHHTVYGCALASGDLFGSGTLSGPCPDQAGSLLELTQCGKEAIALRNGEVRGFLEEGDSIALVGSCSRAGFRRIGFGCSEATVLPSPGAA